MDEGAVERAKERIAQRADAAAIDSALERTRAELEALAQAAATATEGLPERVHEAVQQGLREEAAPVARNLAEVRGLMNQVIHRLERIEGDATGERDARVDDLALLVELITSGWKGVDVRLARLEALVTRLEQGLEERSGALVYRLEDRRPDTAG